MKKIGGIIFLMTLLVLSSGFASAGWFSDTWNFITGKAITVPTSPYGSNLTCTDSDYGVDLYNKGNIKYWAIDNPASVPDMTGWHETEDVCGSDEMLTEFSCDYYSYGEFNPSKKFSCPNGCVDGACVREDMSDVYLIKENIYPFIYEDYGVENLNNEGTLYGAEYKYNETLGENLANIFVFDDSTGWEMFHEEVIEEGFRGTEKWVQINSDFVLTGGLLEGRNNVFVWYNSNKNLGVVITMHDEVKNDNLLDAYLDKYPSTLREESCLSLIDSVNNPEEVLNLQGDELVLIEDQSFESFYTGIYNSSKGYFFVSAMSNSESISQEFLDSSLCSELDFGYDFGSYNSKNKVYSCVLQSDIDNSVNKPQQSYNGLFVIDKGDFSIWIMQQKNQENFQVYDEDYFFKRDALRSQEILVSTLKNLMNNLGERIEINNDYFDILNVFFTDCNHSQFNSYSLTPWSCVTQPVICPPHGEQIVKCTRSVNGKTEVSENTKACTPGVCSGCMVPEWLGEMSPFKNKCIEYGFRVGFDVLDESGKIYRSDFNEGPEDQQWFSVDILDEGVAEVRIIKDVRLLTANETNPIRDIEVSVNGQTFNGYIGETYLVYANQDYKISMRIFDSNGENYLMGQEAIKLHVGEIFDSINDSEDYIEINFIEDYNVYCDLDGRFKQQKKPDWNNEWAKCQNNYECDSNLCSSGECVELKAIAGELQGFKGFLVKMLCRLTNPFSEDGYAQCLSDNI